MDFLDLKRQDPAALGALKAAAKEVGFLTVYDTVIRRQDVLRLLDSYKAFFKGPDAEKRPLIWCLPAQTAAGALRGVEQVSANANPDEKEEFDCGIALAESDSFCALGVYAQNQ